jgi:aminocarboxymuconate-semialdehyde decarboxylase
MRTIDLHAHLTPQCFQREARAGKAWHGMTSAEGELHNPMNGWMPEHRLGRHGLPGQNLERLLSL